MERNTKQRLSLAVGIVPTVVSVAVATQALIIRYDDWWAMVAFSVYVTPIFWVIAAAARAWADGDMQTATFRWTAAVVLLSGPLSVGHLAINLLVEASFVDWLSFGIVTAIAAGNGIYLRRLIKRRRHANNSANPVEKELAP